MTTTPRESKIRTKIIRNLKITFPGLWLVIHGSNMQAKGFPDILGLHRGFFIAIEVKKPGKEKTLTKIQAHYLRKIKEYGGISFMATSWLEVKRKLTKKLAQKLGS